MVYPTLLAAIGDVVTPTWRASAVGVYRLWRDSGYAIGALLAGALADLFGLHMANLEYCDCDSIFGRSCFVPNVRNTTLLTLKTMLQVILRGAFQSCELGHFYSFSFVH